MTTTPPGDLDLLRPWFNVIRRLREAAKDTGTMAVLTVRIVVDERGMPKHWTEPERMSIEPKSANDALVKLLQSLGGGGNGAPAG